MTYEQMREQIKKRWKNEDVKKQKLRALKEPWWFFPLRVILFPVMLIRKLFRWTYGYDEWTLREGSR